MRKSIMKNVLLLGSATALKSLKIFHTILLPALIVLSFSACSYDLAQDLNEPLHVALFIDKDTMAVYLNNTKLADTVLFSPGAAKNFFITAPWEYKNSAKVLVSNFKISAFRN